MVYSPRNMIYYAFGFVLLGGTVLLYFWWTAPESSNPLGETPGETLPDVYNVL